MAWVHQRNGRWQAVVRRRGLRTRSRTFDDEARARSWAERLERRLARPARTLADAIEEYATDPDRDLTPYQDSVLRWWRVQLGRRSLDSLRRSDFVQARDKLRRMRARHGGRLAPATCNWRVSQIAAVLTQAMQRDWIAANPARIPALPERNQRERLLDATERQRLLEACRRSPEPALYPLVVSAMVSGARAGELLRLTWGDIDIERGVGRLLKTKSGRRRPIPIKGVALELLAAMREGEAPTDRVFRHRDGTAPFEYRTTWTEARREAGVLDVRFHDLRHLAASHWAMEGASQRELQELLGHASPAMTTRYTHLIDAHLADWGERLSDRLFDDEAA